MEDERAQATNEDEALERQRQERLKARLRTQNALPEDRAAVTPPRLVFPPTFSRAEWERRRARRKQAKATRQKARRR